MQNSKRQVSTYTRINVLFGSRIAKLLVLFAAMMIAVVTNIYPNPDSWSIFYMVIAVLAYALLFKDYFNRVNLLKYGILTKGTFYNLEDDKYYSQGTLGDHYLRKYNFKFKDSEGKQYDLVKWTTKDNEFEGNKKQEILYSLKNPENALVVSLLQGGPYTVEDDQVYSRVKVTNIFNAFLTAAGIMIIISYLA